MKKTLFVAMLALAACAQAATTAIYWGGTDHVDLLATENGNTHSGSSLHNLSSGATMRMDAVEQLPLLMTEGNTDYDLTFNQTGAVDFYLNKALYFNSVTVGDNLPASFTIDLGSEGSITTAQQFNIGNALPRASVTLSADFAAEETAKLIAAAHSGAQVLYSRDLLVAKGNDGFWNVSDSYNNGTLTFSSSTLASSGLIYVGIKSSEDQIKFGEYGIVYTEASGKVNGNGVEYITLVAKTPEPATATLSLLALAGLCARRRRH